MKSNDDDAKESLSDGAYTAPLKILPCKGQSLLKLRDASHRSFFSLGLQMMYEQMHLMARIFPGHPLPLLPSGRGGVDTQGTPPGFHGPAIGTVQMPCPEDFQKAFGNAPVVLQFKSAPCMGVSIPFPEALRDGSITKTVTTNEGRAQ